MIKSQLQVGFFVGSRATSSHQIVRAGECENYELILIMTGIITTADDTHSPGNYALLLLHMQFISSNEEKIK
jgi:hypothetical protein